MAKVSGASRINGVNVEQLNATIEAVQRDPAAAKFRFQLDNRWDDGGHTRSVISSFVGGGQQVDHENPFQLEADEPPELLGEDEGPNPVEHLLNALAACVTTSLVYHAASRGIAIKQVESKVEGDLDLRGFLGIDPSVRNGLQDIRVDLRIEADVDDAALEELVRMGPTFSPVFDSITHGVPVTVTGKRM